MIIIGYGRNGKQAALKLHKANRAFLVIENNPKAIKDLIAEDKLHIYGDATEDEILDKASIAHAHSLILALPSDADNLFIAISARQQNPNLLIISRVSHESSYKKLKTVGVDNVIMPDKIGGEHMASLVLTPDLIEFVDRIALDGECETNLQEIIIEDKLKEFENKSLIDLDIRKKTGCSIIGIKKPNGQYVVNPDPETKLELKTKIILLGRPDQIEKLKSYF